MTPPLPRRTFLRGAAAAAAALAVPRAASPRTADLLFAESRQTAADTRPNVLFCISDDQSWAHMGAYGDPVVQTPAFNRVAREGVLFSHAFCSAPSCTPSRGTILTGQDFCRLEEGANLSGRLHAKFAVYPDVLEAAGYRVGMNGKGWGPGSTEGTGRTRNPAGPSAPDFRVFLDSVPPDRPFCYWFGSEDPHRDYVLGSGRASGMDLDRVKVPTFLPDHPTVRSDLLDYYYEIERFDRDVEAHLQALETAGRAENTIVVVASDNGMPFPRGKANLYDHGTRMPLAIRWPARVRIGRRIDDFINFADFAPTFLEAAGLPIPVTMSGRSFLDLLMSPRSGRLDPQRRDRVFTGRERHTWCREGGLGYPARAIRTYEYLYIWNLRPDRWPVGDPVPIYFGRRYGDINASPTMDLLYENRHDPAYHHLFELTYGKRPAEELYDVRRDPDQIANMAEDPEFADVRKELRTALEDWMRRVDDPRSRGRGDEWDHYQYYGNY